MLPHSVPAALAAVPAPAGINSQRSHNPRQLHVVCQHMLPSVAIWGQERYLNAHVSPGGWPVLVLNAGLPAASVIIRCPLCRAERDQGGLPRSRQYRTRRTLPSAGCAAPPVEIQLPSVVSAEILRQPTTHPAFTPVSTCSCATASSASIARTDDGPHLRSHHPQRSKGARPTWENVGRRLFAGVTCARAI